MMTAALNRCERFRGSGPGRSVEPTSKTCSVACLLFCSRAQFGRTNPNPGMGDIRELGNIVAGAFAHPDEGGNGEYLPLVGDFLSFNEIVETLNKQRNKFSVKQ